jgi:hypothetical protein
MRVSSAVASIFMVLVDLSMPLILSGDAAVANAMAETVEPSLHAGGSLAAEAAASEIGASQQIGRITSAQPPMDSSLIAIHVLVLTFLSNLGKMFPALCYRRDAHWRERLALAVSM